MISKKQYKILKGIDREEYQWTEETAIDIDDLQRNKLVSTIPSINDCFKGVYRHSITGVGRLEIEKFKNKKRNELISIGIGVAGIIVSVIIGIFS